jgi:hypothetical protein
MMMILLNRLKKYPSQQDRFRVYANKTFQLSMATEMLKCLLKGHDKSSNQRNITSQNRLSAFRGRYVKKQLVVKIWNFTEAYRVDCWRLGSGSAPYHGVDARRVSQQRVLQPRQPETKEGDGNGSFI